MESVSSRSKMIISIVWLLIGVALGWFFHVLLQKNRIEPAENLAYGIRSGDYQYINPLLECEVEGGLQSKQLQNFDDKLTGFTEQTKLSGRAEHISIYYRDLNNGPWTGINEEDVFAPASLLKVPTMIAYLKNIESDPGQLHEPLLDETDSNYANIGTSLTAEDVLKKMIMDSDNDAFSAFVGVIGTDQINKVHTDLGLEVAENDTPENYITVRNYASLFRILYNASYLNREMSEYALKIMAEAKFDEGISAGVPSSVIVANKYGIRGEFDDAIRQLHDCGIVYFPEHPYLLCVMTKGTNVHELASVISDISGMVYDEIDQKY